MHTDIQLIDTVKELTRQGKSARQIGEALSLSRQRASNLIRIANQAPPSWYRWVEAGQVTFKHLEAVLTLPKPEAERLLRECIAMRWSAAVLREEVAIAKGVRQPSEPSADADVAMLEERLSELLATRVRIRAGKDGRSGELALWYTDLETLDGILERLGYTA